MPCEFLGAVGMVCISCRSDSFFFHDFPLSFIYAWNIFKLCELCVRSMVWKGCNLIFFFLDFFIFFFHIYLHICTFFFFSFLCCEIIGYNFIFLLCIRWFIRLQFYFNFFVQFSDIYVCLLTTSLLIIAWMNIMKWKWLSYTVSLD